MLRNRRFDPKSFDLRPNVLQCHYKVHPSEMMRLDTDHMRCPSCKQDVLLPKASTPTGTAVPMERSAVKKKGRHNRTRLPQVFSSWMPRVYARLHVFSGAAWIAA